MTQKKILMIAYYFPPFGGVPVQRTLKFAKYLLKSGWNPLVLTVRDGYDHFHPNDPSLINKIPDDIKIIRARDININTMLIKFLRHKTNANDDSIKTDKKYASKTMKLRSLLYNSLWFPDEKNFWIPSAVFNGLSILSKENIAAIYVSGFPWSAFLVGAFLSKMKKIPLILDFRDAWTLNQRGVWNNRFQRFWENKILLQADKVIFATNLMRKGYIERYQKIDKEKFITITNGYDIEDFQRCKNKKRKYDKRFLITLTGTFNDNVPPLAMDQSPYYFLKGLSKLLQENNISEDILVRFVGNFGVNNKNLIKKLGLENVIEVTGYVSHNRSIEYQMEADLLLLIICQCESSKFILTGKLFEYIGARKPILALVPDGEAKDLIVKEKLGKTVWPMEIDGIKDAIFELFNDWQQNKLKIEGSDYVYKKYDMSTLTKKLVDVIEEIT